MQHSCSPQFVPRSCGWRLSGEDQRAMCTSTTRQETRALSHGP